MIASANGLGNPAIQPLKSSAELWVYNINLDTQLFRWDRSSEVDQLILLSRHATHLYKGIPRMGGSQDLQRLHL